MDQLLKDQVTVITGGSSGIGRAIAILFADHGSRIVVADRSDEPREGGSPTAEVITAAGGEAVFVPGDVTHSADRNAVIAAADALGGTDVLVNNAGIFRTEPFLDVTESSYDQMVDVNVKAAFFMAQASARSMTGSGRGGAIVNLSSVAGIQGAAGFSTYCLAKGAIRLLTYALADELGPAGIRVNALHPGFIETTMTRTDVAIVGTPAADAYIDSIPLRRPGTPEDVARAALFTASGLGGYTTGSSIMVDGGRMRV